MNKEILKRFIAPVVLSVAIGGAIEGNNQVANAANNSGEKTTAIVNMKTGTTIVNIDNVFPDESLGYDPMPEYRNALAEKIAQICDPKDIELVTDHGFPKEAIVICERNTLNRGKVDEVKEIK